MADFTFILDETGEPAQVTCPKGKTVIVEAGRKAGRYKATFMETACASCALLAHCQMKTLKRERGRRLYFTMAEASLARRRQRMKLERQSGRNLRSAVEATVREISCRLGHGRLRVRGKFRVGMTMVASAAMANARRIWRYQMAEKTVTQRQLGTQNGQIVGIFGRIGSLFRLRGRISGRTSCFAVLATFFYSFAKITGCFLKTAVFSSESF